MTPWTDRNGTLSPLKAPVFAALFVPGLWLVGEFFAGTIGPRPLTVLNHESGLWTLRFLFLALAITPLRRLLRWPSLIALRRMIGVAALAYALLHLVAYIADQSFDFGKVASEIVLRLYLGVGFIALLALIPLGITSTDGMIRRLGGKRWRRLHRTTYVIAFLGIVHFFWQAKLEASEALVMGGLVLWLYGYRALDVPMRPLAALALALAAGALTGIGEAAYFALRFGRNFERIFDANFAFGIGWRPAWIVLLICLGLALLAAVRGWFDSRRTSGRRGVATVPASSLPVAVSVTDSRRPR
jgi:sulfoxide reductase heme-binding subunit YedZ